jgi:hypothetical protein
MIEMKADWSEVQACAEALLARSFVGKAVLTVS